MKEASESESAVCIHRRKDQGIGDLRGKTLAKVRESRHYAPKTRRH